MYPPVLVEWYDPTRDALGWEALKDVSFTPDKVMSVGFLISESDKYIVLLSHASPEALQGDFAEDVLFSLAIPRGCVEKITYLHATDN